MFLTEENIPLDLPALNGEVIATIDHDHWSDFNQDTNPIICTDIMVSIGKMRRSIKPTGNEAIDAAVLRYLWDTLKVMAQRQYAEEQFEDADLGGDFVS